jgi:hypothetical protein
VTFARLRVTDWVALVAALALLFVSAADWYSTATGDEARRIEGLTEPSGALGGEVGREVQEEARVTAESEEKNAWQVSGGIDRVILVALLATFVLAVIAAFARAAGRGSHAALPASALPGLAAAATAVLVTYRILQEPGFDESTTVKLGPSLALIVLGVLALASAQSLRSPDAIEPEPEPEPKEAVA